MEIIFRNKTECTIYSGNHGMCNRTPEAKYLPSNNRLCFRGKADKVIHISISLCNVFAPFFFLLSRVGLRSAHNKVLWWWKNRSWDSDEFTHAFSPWLGKNDFWHAVCLCLYVQACAWMAGQILYRYGVQEFIHHRSMTSEYEHSSLKKPQWPRREVSIFSKPILLSPRISLSFGIWQPTVVCCITISLVSKIT